MLQIQLNLCFKQLFILPECNLLGNFLYVMTFLFISPRWNQKHSSLCVSKFFTLIMYGLLEIVRCGGTWSNKALSTAQPLARSTWSVSVSRSAVEHGARGLNRLHLFLNYCTRCCVLHISLARLQQSTRKESFRFVLIIAIDNNNNNNNKWFLIIMDAIISHL